MKTSILLTGASGFAGKSLTRYLSKKKIRITKIVFKHPTNTRDKKIDLTRKIKLKSNFDWIIHTAAYHKIKDFKRNAKVKSKKNILMVKNLIDFSKKKKYKKFYLFFNDRCKLFTLPG